MNVTTVFLSSTLEDLKPYRDAAKDALNRLDQIHCVSMEEFGARSEAPDELCRELVSRADLYVGILGHCYGSCPPGSPLSFTVREFNAALEARRAQLVFLLAEDVSPTADEPHELREKQRVFRKFVRDRVTTASFSSTMELGMQIVAGVSNWLGRRRDVAEHGAEFLVSLRLLARHSGMVGALLLAVAAVAAVGTFVAATASLLSVQLGPMGLMAALLLFLAGMALGVLGFFCWGRELEASMTPYSYIDEGSAALKRLLGDTPHHGAL
jgi:hypothetical protein